MYYTKKVMNTKKIKIASSLSKILVLAVLIGGLSACDGNGEIDPSKKQEVLALLTVSTWNVSSVVVDDVDASSNFQNLSLTFGEDSFTSTNGGAIWPSTGTFVFTSPDANAFITDSGLEVSIIELNEISLQLGLSWSETTIGTGGRLSSISGNYVFSFVK